MDKLKWLLLGYFLRGSDRTPDKPEEPEEPKPDDTISSFRMTIEVICFILFFFVGVFLKIILAIIFFIALFFGIKEFFKDTKGGPH